MSRQSHQKVKIMKLYELLKQNTDEEHPMSTYEIIAKLEDMGIPVERKTVYEDIKTLNDNGYEVLTARERTNKYFVEDRNFDIAELRILLDSVQAASFITPKKTLEMVEKIAALGGSNRAKLLKENIVWFDTVKHSNEVIYYSIDSINRAITTDKQLSFKYFGYNTKGERIYKKEGERYVVSPVALIFADDNYYLITYNDKYSSTVHYRVDRMDSVEVLEDNIPQKALDQRDKMPEYKSKIFDMYGGKSKVAEFIADQSMVDVVTDKFGEKLIMHDLGEGTFKFRANVLLSPNFYGWVATFGKRLKLIGDQELLDGYKEFLKTAQENVE